MDPKLIDPEQHVLSTLEADGSRRWLRPRLSHGRLLVLRRIVAYLLIATYTLLPYVEVGGRPFVLLDIPARRFTIFGFTFLPTDTLLLALAMVGTLLGFFLATALVGRVWCGWACPQTVYMEFLFRPIDRLIEGTVGRGGAPRKPLGPARIAAKYIIYLALAFFLANTFISYFVGVEALRHWMGASPIEHPAPFIVMAFLTGAMMFHFTYFREQLCILACPYGRLQSVLLDESSLIVSYDAKRGEPRGKKTHLAVTDQPPRGDCIDCGLCVVTCPTGIDIRKGLQMECVNCTQCIDACNGVMKKVGRAPDLIRYSSQRRDQGQGKAGLLRPRVIIYPALLTFIAALFFVVLAGKASFDAVLLRSPGQPFTTADNGAVRNMVRLKLTNRADVAQGYRLEVLQPTQAVVELDLVGDALSLASEATQTFPISVVAPAALYVGSRGTLSLQLRVVADDGQTRVVDCSLLGPETLPRPGA